MTAMQLRSGSLTEHALQVGNTLGRDCDRGDSPMRGGHKTSWLSSQPIDPSRTNLMRWPIQKAS